MKSLAKSVMSGLYKYSGAMHAQECLSFWSGRRFMTVVVFHRVTDDIPEDGLTVSTHWFRGFCAMMRDRFNVVSMGEFHRLLTARRPFPRRTVAITFDDCYRDNLFAARVLAEHHLPATFFIPPKYVGTQEVFEWDRHLKRMDNLTWDEVEEMVQLGHEIGSHTYSHADLGVIGREEAHMELRESKRVLEDRLGRPVRWFAYPYGARGNFRPEFLPLVYELGYEACFSAISGFVYPEMFGEILPREAMPCFRSLLNLEVHLSGCLDWYYEVKRSAATLLS